MVSNEIEVPGPAASVETLKKIASGRALDRRHFMTALGIAGAASGAALVAGRTAAHPNPNPKTRPSTVEAAGPGPLDYLNFLLSLAYLEATFYAYITTGADIPYTTGVTVGSGAITLPPLAKLVFTGTYAAQITDLLNEIYYDELNRVIALRNLLGSVAIARPAINLGAATTTAVTASNALSVARLLEDVGASAYAGAAIALAATPYITYGAQILAVEAFHAGALRLVSIQNPTIAAYLDTGIATFIGSATAGSNVIANVYFTATSGPILVVGQVLLGTGIPSGATITVITGGNINTAITGVLTSASANVTAVSSTSGLAVGQTITGTGIPAATTIKTIGTGTLTLSANATASSTVASPTAIAVGTGSITISSNATVTGVSTVFAVTDTVDVMPADPGTAALSAAGPAIIPGTGTSQTPYEGFFATSGASSLNVNSPLVTPAGFAFARSSSEVLAILTGTSATASSGILMVNHAPTNGGSSAGGFFPSGTGGLLNYV